MIYFVANRRAEVCSLFRAQRRKHNTHPADARVGTGHVRRGSGKGGESCWRGVTVLFLGEGTQRVTMEFAPWCGAIYCIFDGVA